MKKLRTKLLIISGSLSLVFVGILLLTPASSFNSPRTTSTRPSSQNHSSSSKAQVVAYRNTNDAHKDSSTPPSSSAQTTSYAANSSSIPSTVTENGTTYPIRTYETQATTATSDPYGSQWWTQTTGLNQTWSITPPSTAKQTTVAIIDTGFALNQEDLVGRWATNPGESGPTTQEAPSKLNCTDQGLPISASCNLLDDNYDGIVDNETGAATLENPSELNCTDQGKPLDKSCNMIDDDGNGYVDDYKGYDFVDGDNNVQAGQVNPDGTGTTHGTEVAGVLGATGNNGKGIAGVDWNTKILPLQAIDDNGYGNTLTVTRAVRYAADRGADVISMSLGSTQPDDYLRQAIQYALDKGSVVVAAAGNDSSNGTLSYPAQYPEVLAVGAESSAGGPDSFSDQGANLDIMAPGDNILTTTWLKTNGASAYVNNVAGTSFSTPFIAGLLSRARALQPNASWGEIIAALEATANHGSLTNTNPHSNSYGAGYARANSFLNRITSASSPTSRYYFATLSDPTQQLSSKLAYQCTSSDFPTTLIYTLTSGSQTLYTDNPLVKVRNEMNGWTTINSFYACLGLPTDTPGFSRTLNIDREFGTGKQAKPITSNENSSAN